MDEDVKDIIEVVKKYVEKAWTDSFAETNQRYNQEVADIVWDDDDHVLFKTRKLEWLKETGIIE